MSDNLTRQDVLIPSGSVQLEGELIIPEGASGIVVFAHGSGSSRHSSRNQYVAGVIRDANLGTLLFDLLTPEEGEIDNQTRHLRFDIGLLSRRLASAARWLMDREDSRDLSIGFFGASTGAAAALVAAAELGERIGAVVSRGGRPDLAGESLSEVKAPTLLIVGSFDDVVIGLNEEAFAQLNCKKELKIIAGATHLFEEPGTLETAAGLAAGWFQHFLNRNVVKAVA